MTNPLLSRSLQASEIPMLIGVAILTISLAGCSGSEKVHAGANPDASAGNVKVGVAPVTLKPMSRSLTLSSELVPFQEIDVYAKEAGYVKELLVDYGTRVKAGQLMAVLEIPELQIQVQQDEAAIKSATDQVTHAQHEVSRVEAQQKVFQLQFDRLDKVATSQPGLVAQQEVDDAQGKALASAAQVESAQSNLAVMQGQLDSAKAKREHDQVLFDYARITAPFAGVVTQRYANQGTLMQAGTGSSTQALPLVRLSQDNLFRLSIPVPESYVRYIRIGDAVQVSVPALSRVYTGKIARFSVDVKEDTRTMHTEVDIPNTDGKLIPGMYAEATLALDQKQNAIAVPLQAVNQDNNQSNVYVVDAAGKVAIRPVKLGMQTSTDAEVLSGLTPGEKVIVSDRSSLKAGEPVTPQDVSLVQYQGQEDQK
jgi:RND family efflux transporter MFP subunit